MFKSYLKIAWRNLVRQKMYSLIKIGGFAIGISACLLIALFVRQELSYDLHYTGQDRIFRIVREATMRGNVGTGVHFPAPFANALRDDFMEIEKVGRYRGGNGSTEVRRLDKTESAHEERFIFMDQDLVDIFSLSFISGDPKTALREKNSMVINKTKADKYFPNEDPLGKIIILNNDESVQYTITAVIDDLPLTSHLQYDFILTLSGFEFYPGEQTNWVNDNYPTYIMLKPGTDVGRFENKMLRVINSYFLPGAIQAGGDQSGAIAWLKSMKFHLQPVHDIYLNLEDIGDNLPHGDIHYIWLFGAIASFILIIAGINFINLSTARSANRAREVGLRKVVGSRRGALIRQFLSESVIYSLFSVALGVSLAIIALPYFNELLSRSLAFPWSAWWMFPMLIVGGVTIGLLAGCYPSFYLSAFRPIEVLKGKVSTGARNARTRSVLVVFQFTVSIVLTVATFVIGRQMDYMLTKKLGYDKDQVIILQGTYTLNEKIVTFKNELQRLPGVGHATISGYLPLSGTERNQNNFYNDGRKGIDESVHGQRWEVDHDYIKTLGLKILNGRDFSPQISSDSQAVIINHSMARELNLENPIGRIITNGWGSWPIIGVVEDFHFESLKERIGPLSMQIGRSTNSVMVKVDSKDMRSVISSIAKVWSRFAPGQAIRYTFLDEGYARMYDDTSRIGYVFSSFAILAVIVACLGLFALSAFMVEQRNKEISIRLVLGASINSIFQLLTVNFVKLVVISLILSVPLSLYFMNRWLSEFAYKIDIGWQVFVLAGIMSVATAVLTITYQSLRAALTNPASNLRSE